MTPARRPPGLRARARAAAAACALAAVLPAARAASLCPARDVAAGEHHSLGLGADGTVWAWGLNGKGQLGNGTMASSSVPVPVSSLGGAVAVAAGALHSLALDSSGAVWAWGDNEWGELGDGSGVPGTDAALPVKVRGISDAVAIAAGRSHSLALRADGTVWCWGSNLLGQLGTGVPGDSDVPLQVTGLAGVVAIAAGGGDHALALTARGEVWAWGDDANGQLGDGTTGFSPVPVRVLGLLPPAAIASGERHSLALQGGAAWAWGFDFWGQLGDGGNSDRSVPAQVPGLAAPVRIAGGGGHTLAVTSAEELWAWGRNGKGQLGDGTTTDRASPVHVLGLAGARTASGGSEHTLAVDAGGDVWGWGRNGAGQVGDGTTADASLPVRVTRCAAGCLPPFLAGATTAVASGDCAATVAWPAARGEAPFTYDVYRSATCPATTSGLRVATGLTATTFVDASLPFGAAACYAVEAVDSCALPAPGRAAGTSSTRVAGGDASPPVAGGPLAALPAGCSVRLDWGASDACSGVVRYEVYRATASPVVPGPATLVTSVASLPAADVPPADGTYHYLVRAVNGAALATDSSEAPAQVLGCACVAASLGEDAELRVVKRLPGGAAFTWTPAGGAVEHHVNSVAAKTALTPADPLSPRQPPGSGTLRCAAGTGGGSCVDAGALAEAPAALYYRVLAACGPRGADEGTP